MSLPPVLFLNEAEESGEVPQAGLEHQQMLVAYNLWEGKGRGAQWAEEQGKFDWKERARSEEDLRSHSRRCKAVVGVTTLEAGTWKDHSFKLS